MLEGVRVEADLPCVGEVVEAVYRVVEGRRVVVVGKVVVEARVVVNQLWVV
jgi:hypothetical protein